VSRGGGYTIVLICMLLYFLIWEWIEVAFGLAYRDFIVV